MDLNELTGKFVEIREKGLFDEVRIFGIVKKIDCLDNVYVKIKYRFYKTFFNTPRFFTWNPFFQKRKVVWYDGRDDPKDWNFELGDTLQFSPSKINLSSEEIPLKFLERINDLEKIKGGWFGFF